ncbi:MAG: hypothetical protein K0S00_2316 [Xanthobacteraceae bacterium]|jgi:uncharacterized protein YqeY|nr:hypothetical protein [Xanthobacteraceae bacterium]
MRAAVRPGGESGARPRDFLEGVRNVLRDEINTSLKDAMKAQDKLRLGTLRLVNAAIKDRDIDQRGHGKDPLTDDEVLGLLTKMIKQREESAKVYEEAGRVDLATQEREEIAVIASFLPQQMSEAESQAAIAAVIAEIDAHGLKDMGRTMAALKERYTGVMDFGKASGTVKTLLTAG